MDFGFDLDIGFEMKRLVIFRAGGLVQFKADNALKQQRCIEKNVEHVMSRFSLCHLTEQRSHRVD